MRNRALTTILASLLCAGALALGACGGDDNSRREIDWRPDSRAPQYTAHWWWEPTERACEEDEDCRTGETCNLMRLGTCPGCPRGEDARICVDRDGTSGGASTARAGR